MKTLEYYLEAMLCKTCVTREEALRICDPFCSIKENLSKVIDHFELQEESGKNILQCMENLLDLTILDKKDRWDGNIPNAVGLPEIPSDIYEKGIGPLVCTGVSWKNTLCYGIDTQSIFHDFEHFPDTPIHTLSVHIAGENTNIFLREPVFDGNFLERLEQLHPELFGTPTQNIIFFSHTLYFDLTQLFGPRIGNLLLKKDPATRKASNGKMQFLEMDYKEKKVFFIHTGNFFLGTLKKIVKEYFPESTLLPAYEKFPTTKQQWTLVEKYGEQQARLHYTLGMLIRQEQERDTIGITFSLAGESSKKFRKKYLKKPIYMPKKEIAEFIYTSNYGGFSQVFARGYGKDTLCYLYDYKGLYAATMMNVALPFSCNKKNNYRRLLDREVFDAKDTEIVGWAKISFEFPKETLYPCLTVRAEKNYTPLKGEGTYTTYEIRFALELGCSIKIHEAWGWDVEPEDLEHPLKEYIQKLSDEKDALDREYQTTKNPALLIKRYIVKLRINATWGKFGEIHEGTAGRMFHPAFSSLILGWSKIRLLRMINRIHRTGGKVLFSETDSILSTIRLEDYSTLKKYVGDVTGKLTNETPQGVYPFIVRSRIYMLLEKNTRRPTKLSHHNVHFSQAAIECKGSIKNEPHTNIILDTQQSYICPICGMDYTPYEEPLDPRYLDASQLAGLLETVPDSIIEYTTKHYVKVQESLHRPYRRIHEKEVVNVPNKFIHVDSQLNALPDDKRIYEKDIRTFEGLRQGLVWSIPRETIPQKSLFPQK